MPEITRRTGRFGSSDLVSHELPVADLTPTTASAVRNAHASRTVVNPMPVHLSSSMS